MKKDSDGALANRRAAHSSDDLGVGTRIEADNDDPDHAATK